MSETNKLITFGGMRITDSVPQLDLRGRQRADRVLQHYYDNQRSFQAKGAWILCSGGWPGFGRNMIPPPETFREGRLTANYLHYHGIPSVLIHEEIESQSSVKAITNAHRDGYLDATTFNPEDPLGIVSDRRHANRCIRIVRKLGIEAESIQRIESPEQNDLLRELIIGSVYAAGLAAAHGPEQLEWREDRVIAPAYRLMQRVIGENVTLNPGA